MIQGQDEVRGLTSSPIDGLLPVTFTVPETERDPSLAIPGALSSDLAGGYSNAWYTTIDRDPFAWAYKTADGDMVGSQTPDNTLGKLIVGPRWRLLNDKFGQNLPHLEMPAPVATDPNNPACVAPPYEKEDKKFETGDVLDDPTTINLLDWKQTAADARWDDAQSPLAYTSGWTTTWSGQDTKVKGIRFPGPPSQPLVPA